MKLGILSIVLAAALVLVACAGRASSDSAASQRTYSSPGFHYAVTYDDAAFAARLESDASGSGLDLLLPGVGKVHADAQVLIVAAKAPASLPQYLRGEFQLTALRPRQAPRRPSLAAFSREPYLRKLRARGWLTSGPREVTLGGLPAFRFTMRFRGVSAVDYALYRGAFIYAINLEAPSKRWPAVGPALEAVARSFAVTP